MTPGPRRARVAILIATHNDHGTIDAAIGSVSQGVCPVDVYLVDDFSDMPIGQSRAHDNVVVMRTEENVGLTRALNIGLQRILEMGYEYVGRMDADDISVKHRIDSQVRFLDENSKVSGVGGWADYVDEESGRLVFVHRTPCHPDDVAKRLRFNNCVLHPTWLMRSTLYSEMRGYNERFAVSQDYEFLMRASSAGHRFANIPEVLLKYRISSGGISVKKRRKQLAARMRVQLSYFDPRSASSWIGLARTFALFAVPRALVTRMKSVFSQNKCEAFNG